MLRSLIFFIFREMVLTKRKKNTIFTNERSVLWVCAEHYRIERPTACWVWGPPDRFGKQLDTLRQSAVEIITFLQEGL